MSAHTSKAARRVSWFILFLIGVALTVALYFVKTHAQSAKRDVRELSAAIAAEEAAIRVLRAELAYLDNPARLSDLATEHLSTSPTTPNREAGLDMIAKRFPLTSDVEASAP